MPRFVAIEGLRAWLAWAVVLSHICQSVGAESRGGHWVWLMRGGTTAVFVFVVLSGFVICGLVLDKREPWPQYILRRAFRLFPAYLIAYAAALAVLPLAIAALDHLSWINDPAFTYDDLLRGWAQAMADHPWEHVVLHVLLLQGVVPDSILPHSATAVLGPAWSLSLEWQFYLVAPGLVWLLARPSTRLGTAVLIVLAVALQRKGLFGQFSAPSFLPGVGYMFLIGIGCRLGFAQLKGLRIALEVPVLLLGLGLLYPEMLWLAVWLALLAYLAAAETWRDSERDRLLWRAMRGALESPVATYLGARSYSVFLIHLPIIQVATWLIVSRWTLTQAELFAALTVVVVPATLILSDVLHRTVERPMIELGARLARRQHRATPREA
jgi:peptidoglycan/LPS O-acetylase OafA/YrhL